MGSRAVVIVCRDEDAARERFGVVDEGSRHRATRAPAGASSTTPRSRRELLDRRARGARRRRLLGRARDRLGLPRLRADALVGQGAGAAARASTPRSGAAARAALGGGRRGARARRGARRSTSATLLERYRERADAGRRASSTAYRRYCWPVDVARRPASSRRSTCWPPRAQVHVDQRPRLAHGDARAALPRPIRQLLLATPYQRRRPDRRRRARRPASPGGRS